MKLPAVAIAAAFACGILLGGWHMPQLHRNLCDKIAAWRWLCADSCALLGPLLFSAQEQAEIAGFFVSCWPN